jgi:hypothetical protein
MEYGGRLLADAVELWRLVDERQANALWDFLARAEESDPERAPYWRPEQVSQLVDLVSGLTEALQEAGIMDDAFLTRLDQVPELARRVTSIDARPERSDWELRNALAELVFRVEGVRMFLTRVVEAGYGVELS